MLIQVEVDEELIDHLGNRKVEPYLILLLNYATLQGNNRTTGRQMQSVIALKNWV